MAISLSDTSVSLYWNSLVIPDFDIANYTVVYTRIPTSSEAAEVKVVFPGSSTSAIVTGLTPDTSYQFQVFATVSVAGQPVEGERSLPLLQTLSKGYCSETCE